MLFSTVKTAVKNKSIQFDRTGLEFSISGIAFLSSVMQLHVTGPQRYRESSEGLLGLFFISVHPQSSYRHLLSLMFALIHVS